MWWNSCEHQSSWYPVGVNAFRHGPGGHDEVHDPLAQTFGNLVELEEVADVVEHLVVSVGVGVHLLKDGGDVSKDGRIQQRYERKEPMLKLFFFFFKRETIKYIHDQPTDLVLLEQDLFL